MERALNFVNEMRQQGIRPNVVTYNSLIRGASVTPLWHPSQSLVTDEILDLMEQDIEDLKQQYDEIGEDGNIMNSYVLPRPVSEIKKEMRDFIDRGKKEIEEISEKRNKAFEKIRQKNYEHIL